MACRTKCWCCWLAAGLLSSTPQQQEQPMKTYGEAAFYPARRWRLSAARFCTTPPAAVAVVVTRASQMPEQPGILGAVKALLLAASCADHAACAVPAARFLGIGSSDRNVRARCAEPPLRRAMQAVFSTMGGGWLQRGLPGLPRSR